jgi:hypothetical protein
MKTVEQEVTETIAFASKASLVQALLIGDPPGCSMVQTIRIMEAIKARLQVLIPGCVYVRWTNDEHVSAEDSPSVVVGFPNGWRMYLAPNRYGWWRPMAVKDNERLLKEGQMPALETAAECLQYIRRFIPEFGT